MEMAVGIDFYAYCKCYARKILLILHRHDNVLLNFWSGIDQLDERP